MRTIEIMTTVGPDGTLTTHVPTDISPGEHRVVLVIEEKPRARAERLPLDFPVHDLGLWPANLSLRREDLYGDFGR